MIQPNLHLYKLTQDELRDYITMILIQKKIPFIEVHGCIFSGDIVKNRPLFVAHMDTVKDADVSGKLRISGNTLSRKGQRILGADDRAGVDILLRHIEDINFCFTRDEELGGVGAHLLDTNPEFCYILENVSCAIQYDRRGSSDIIPYGPSDFIREIENLTGYKSAYGTFTDVAVWEDSVAGANMSVGYSKEHTSAETLDIEAWNYALETLPILNENLTERIKPNPPRQFSHRISNYSYADEYDYHWSDEDLSWYMDSERDFRHTCAYCQKEDTFKLTFYEDEDGNYCCEDCLTLVYGLRRIS